MTTIETQIRPTTRRTATAKTEIYKVLAVIDGSERTGRVVEYALNLAQIGRASDVVLLGIVAQPPDGRLRGYGSFKRDEIHAQLKDAMGRRAVGAAARRFDRADIAHKDRVEVGDPVETILRVAGEEDADVILIADAPAGVVQRWLPKTVGLSVATTTSQVAQLAEMPVVVVK